MEPKPAPVKQKRPYDSTRRTEQARQTHDAILDTARRMFLRDGYAATTTAAIALVVGVSADTIYKTFGGKAGLVRSLCEQALAGAGPIPAEARSDALQTNEPDPRKIIRGWGALTLEVAPNVLPILLLVRTAGATDPEMAALYTEMGAQRLARMTHNARNLDTAGHLRDNLTVEQAGEIMWTYSSPELYELLVLTRSWPLDRYATFIADAMIAALLPPPNATNRTPRRR
jgi:AcrR family transcriptional regulator